MAAGEQNPTDHFSLTWTNIGGIVLVSAVYFADIFLKAKEKCYWFDELCTVYLCRLPSFHDTWTAVWHGADFNPPLFYLLTRGARWVFGHGLIATRLPATLGVWLFGLSLFIFVARRTDAYCGLIAGVFPFFTLAQYYAYEARPHGITLGWCGLALLCWQRNADGREKYLWLSGFGLCLFGALLTHVYAIYLLVPFAFVEFYSLLKRDRPNWGIIGSMLLASVPVVMFIYLPLTRSYQATVPAFFFPASHEMLQGFLVAAIGPALGILLISLALIAVDASRRSPTVIATVDVPMREMLLAASFLLIPVVGFIGSKISHGPFIDRYFLPFVAGLAILLGFAHFRRQSTFWATRVLAGCMLSLMLFDLGATIYFSRQNRILLIEPSSRLLVSTTPSDPMRMYRTVSLDRSGLDILVLPGLEYFYFFEYAPPSVISRLYFAAPTDDVTFVLYERLAKWAHVDFKTTTFSSFLSAHRKFLVYETRDGANLAALKAIANTGSTLVSARGDTGGTMYEFAR